MGVYTPAFAVRNASGATLEYLLPLNKLDATTAPTVNDDSGDGYIPGSMWTDTTNDLTYFCQDNTLGAAVWKLVGSGAGSVTSVDGSGGSTGLTLTGGPITSSGTLTLGGTLSNANGGTGANLSATGPGIIGQTSSGANLGILSTATYPSLTELSYVKGVTSAIQTQLGAKQPLDATLTAFAALTIAANSLTIGTGTDAFSQTTFAANTFPARESTGNLEAKTITDFGLSLVDDADAATARTTLGIGSLAGSNQLYNGDMQVSQRGDGAWTSSTTPANNDNTTLIDTWKLLSDGNNIVSVLRYTTPQTDGASFTMGRAWQNTVVTANKKFGMISWLESKDAIGLRNQAVSVSCKVTAGAAWSYLRLGVITWTGTADSVGDPISTWNADGVTPTLNTNYAFGGSNTPTAISVGNFKQLTCNVSSLGNTLNNLGVIFWVDDATSSVSDTLSISDVKLEIGSTVTSFVPRPYTAQLTICQRFFFSLGGSTNRLPATGRADGTSTGFWTYPVGVKMRIDPSLSIAGSGSFQLNDGSVQLTASSISTNYSSQQCIAANFGMSASTFTLYRPLFGVFTDTTTYLWASAEL